MKPQDDELTELLAKLVSIESYSGNEGKVQNFIADWFHSNGLRATLEPVKDGLLNVVVQIEGSGPGPSIWIGGHSDTVSPSVDWTLEPHTPVVRDGRLYGVGAMDMKSGLATAMHAVRDLARQRDWQGTLTFVSLADEEAYSRGAKGFVAADQLRFDAAIMCEPHFEDPNIGAIGKVNLRVLVKGLSAHGAWPDRGINAVTQAGRLITLIDTIERPPDPRFGRGTHCVLSISSGNGKYEIRVPDHCEFLVNWHFMPNETAEQAVATLQGLADSLNSPATFEITIIEPRYDSYRLPADHPFVVAFVKAYRANVGRTPTLGFAFGVSDANVLVGERGIPTILFGPSGANLHAADEWADLGQMAVAKSVYVDLARALLADRSARSTE